MVLMHPDKQLKLAFLSHASRCVSLTPCQL